MWTRPPETESEALYRGLLESVASRAEELRHAIQPGAARFALGRVAELVRAALTIPRLPVESMGDTVGAIRLQAAEAFRAFPPGSASFVALGAIVADLVGIESAARAAKAEADKVASQARSRGLADDLDDAREMIAERVEDHADPLDPRSALGHAAGAVGAIVPPPDDATGRPSASVPSDAWRDLVADVYDKGMSLRVFYGHLNEHGTPPPGFGPPPARIADGHVWSKCGDIWSTLSTPRSWVVHHLQGALEWLTRPPGPDDDYTPAERHANAAKSLADLVKLVATLVARSPAEGGAAGYAAWLMAAVERLRRMADEVDFTLTTAGERVAELRGAIRDLIESLASEDSATTRLRRAEVVGGDWLVGGLDEIRDMAANHCEPEHVARRMERIRLAADSLAAEVVEARGRAVAPGGSSPSASPSPRGMDVPRMSADYEQGPGPGDDESAAADLASSLGLLAERMVEMHASGSRAAVAWSDFRDDVAEIAGPEDRDASGPDYASMSAGEFLRALGTDARLWADAFRQIAPPRRHPVMIGWFANAIMAGYDEAMNRCRVLDEAEAEDDAGRGPGPTSAEESKWAREVVEAIGSARLAEGRRLGNIRIEVDVFAVDGDQADRPETPTESKS